MKRPAADLIKLDQAKAMSARRRGQAFAVTMSDGSIFRYLDGRLEDFIDVVAIRAIG